MVSNVARSGWAALACLAAALSLAACSTSAANSSAGSKTASGPPLVIGVSMSLSGDFATLANPAKTHDILAKLDFIFAWRSAEFAGQSRLDRYGGLNLSFRLP